MDHSLTIELAIDQPPVVRIASLYNWSELAQICLKSATHNQGGKAKSFFQSNLDGHTQRPWLDRRL